MDAYALLSTAVGGLLLFLAIAFFKHKAEITSLSSKIRVLEGGKVKLETENRKLVQKVAELQSVNVEQQAKITKKEVYPIDKNTGFPKDPFSGKFICPICLQESPQKVLVLQENEKSWSRPKGPTPHFFQWKS